MEIRSFTIRYGRTQVFFGLDSTRRLDSVLKEARRVLVVTGRRGASTSGALSDVLSLASELGLEVYLHQGVEPNPTVDSVDRVAEKAWRSRADLIIAVGGGSVIDAAKLASVIAVCGCSARDYLKGRCSPCGSIPLLAVNLTHGTGSEVNRYSVISDPAGGEKLGIASEAFYPLASADNPRYTVTLPRSQTIYTSLDALYHFIEASTSRMSSPMVVSLAREGVRLIAEFLPRVVREPGDLEARYWLMYASMLAGIAIDNARTHIIHVMEHVLTGMNPSLAHGAGLAILGPHAVKHACREALEVCTSILDPIVSRFGSRESPESIARSISEFQKSLGFDENLASYGFDASHADEVARRALDLFPVQLGLAPMSVTGDLLKTIYYDALKSS